MEGWRLLVSRLQPKRRPFTANRSGLFYPRIGTSRDLTEADDQPRKRAIHGAIAATLAAEGGTERLSMLAYHALQAGDEAQAVATTLQAARAALEMYAPEEAVRLVDAALAAASEPKDRIEMLRVKDDALEVLDREGDRLANLAEMTALTGAIPSPALEAEVKLRRASAARAAQDFAFDFWDYVQKRR